MLQVCNCYRLYRLYNNISYTYTNGRLQDFGRKAWVDKVLMNCWHGANKGAENKTKNAKNLNVENILYFLTLS